MKAYTWFSENLLHFPLSIYYISDLSVTENEMHSQSTPCPAAGTFPVRPESGFQNRKRTGRVRNRYWSFGRTCSSIYRGYHYQKENPFGEAESPGDLYLDKPSRRL